MKLNDKFWDGLNVRFGTDINSNQKAEWKNFNRIEASHGYSHPDIFSSWEGNGYLAGMAITVGIVLSQQDPE